jgi:hypothetical protein
MIVIDNKSEFFNVIYKDTIIDVVAEYEITYDQYVSFDEAYGRKVATTERDVIAFKINGIYSDSINYDLNDNILFEHDDEIHDHHVHNQVLHQLRLGAL